MITAAAEADLLPKRRPGRQSAAATIEYQQKVAAFCELILQIQSTMDFAVGSRGWCYILERHGLRKGDFDAAERLIADCRKSGELPLDICAEDELRKVIGIERLDNRDTEEEAASWIDHVSNNAHKIYTPISFWDDLESMSRSRSRSSTCAICSRRYAPTSTSRSPISRAGPT